MPDPSIPIPAPVTAAVHGPYEDLAIELVHLFGKLIDGQTAEQKAKIWQGWIDFWGPLLQKRQG